MLLKKSLFILFLIALSTLWSCIQDPKPSAQNYELYVTAQDKYPAFSPDGSRIAYYHYDFPESEAYPTGLYVIDSDGLNRQLILKGNHYDPSWSPDGTWLVFSSAGVIQKCTINGDSLTTFDSQLESGLFSPDWTSNDKILFDRAINFDGESNLFSMDVKFENVMPIYGYVIIAGRSPEQSPNKNSIVFMKASKEWSQWEIFILNISNGRETRLTFSNDNRAPTWSPSGNHIAWSSNVRIFTMKTDGSEQTFLHYGNRPSWSVNDEIVFSAANSDITKEVLYIINPDSTNLIQITF